MGKRRSAIGLGVSAVFVVLLLRQVDGGELRDVVIGGKVTTVYFLVFVLSFSRLTHFSLSPRPIDTDTCIRMHDAAFRYFGGVPEECVYDARTGRGLHHRR